ncbi:hypothetical protein FE783_19455 [Paenibacillus mesophilus]|uniref:hypothetical protein n=1 Tax=Paenibacillus mesophilus TaxID=2582849 RepID=UPI00110E29EA|nr:hypothetical protein [Paenibacillus mesophilus]TMV48130.1 hypothetical protein FE783_19455 [Paenibacillus mesophilus]
MEWMIMLLAVLLLIAWIALRGAGWKTLLVGSGDSGNELEAKYAYLKSNDVKCRLKFEEAAGMGIAQADVAGRGRSTVKLDVHKNDVERANELLREFDRPLPL